MFEKRIDARQAKRIETLEKRCEKLSDINKELQAERDAFERELNICRIKLDKIEHSEAEFMSATREMQEARVAYESARKDMDIIRKRYKEQMEALIDGIKQ